MIVIIRGSRIIELRYTELVMNTTTTPTLPENFIPAYGDAQCRYNGIQHTVLGWDAGCDQIALANGEIIPRTAMVSLKPFSVSAQVWEWYGDEEFVGVEAHGRYKAKGGEEFIVWLTENEAMYGDIVDKLNEKFNKTDLFYKYEFKHDPMPYYAPRTLVGDPTKGFDWV